MIQAPRRLRVLVAEDDETLVKLYPLMLSPRYEVEVCTSVGDAISAVKTKKFDAAVIDLHFRKSKRSGGEILDEFNRSQPSTYLIIFTGTTRTKLVVESSRKRHFELLAKEPETGVYPVINSLKKVEERLFRKFAPHSGLYQTESPLMREALIEVDRIVDSAIKDRRFSPILILGETGTGKEHVARHIAIRANKRLVSLNMAAFSSNTLESELFGHERGAFTGAHQNKVGLFETAHNEIAFLDEIGEASLDLQSKLLRVIESGVFYSVGGVKEKSVRTWFIAATHQNIFEESSFRSDLFQRLSAFPIRIPSLRERPEDIRLLSDLFLNNLSQEGTALTLTEDGLSVLLAHSWPGNIRELKNVIERLRVLNEHSQFNEIDVIRAIEKGAPQKLSDAKQDQIEPECTLCPGNFSDLTYRKIQDTLKANDNNRRKTAEKLKMSEATLYRKLKEMTLRTGA